MCQVNLVRLQNGGGFNSDEGTITVRTVYVMNETKKNPNFCPNIFRRSIFYK